MEQTFNDLHNEKRQEKKGLLVFVLWTFIEAAIGIFRERLLLITEGVGMQTALGTLGLSRGISFLLIRPLLVMEVANRQAFNEEFPFMLFFVLWFNLFAISLILLPIMRARRTSDHDLASPVATQGNTLLTTPKSALMTSLILILFIVILSFLASLGWEPLERLINGTG